MHVQNSKYSSFKIQIIVDPNSDIDGLMNENSSASHKTDEDSAFCLLLNHRNMIRVGPKSTLAIPVCFAPTEMMKYDALCTVVVWKEDGGKWQYAPRDNEG